jgi:hypothetical protein
MTYQGRTYRSPADLWRITDLTTLSVEALGIVLLIGSYSADQMTDGAIPKSYLGAILDEKGVQKRAQKTLISDLKTAGLLVENDRSYTLTNYLDTNLSRADWEAQKAAERTKKRSQRNPGSDSNGDDESHSAPKSNQTLRPNVPEGHGTGQAQGHLPGTHNGTGLGTIIGDTEGDKPGGQVPGPRARALSPGLLVTRSPEEEEGSGDDNATPPSGQLDPLLVLHRLAEKHGGWIGSLRASDRVRRSAEKVISLAQSTARVKHTTWELALELILRRWFRDKPDRINLPNWPMRLAEDWQATAALVDDEGQQNPTEDP